MTTMAQIDATLARFNRKSPRDAYKQVCEELGIHYQREIYNMLPEVPSAWHRIRTLELDHTLLGPKGCMALLPLILVSTTLRKISLRSCGLTDQFVIELCNILQGHPAVRAVDVGDNELVSVFVASSVISLMSSNTNMVEFVLTGTHIGDNVADIVANLGFRNQQLVATYYQDNYFKLKNLFGYLDEDGQGWVLLKSLIMNCPYPVLQEQFVERIGKMKPKKRSDNTISISTFMNLVYMNYKTEVEIAKHAEKTIDEPYVFMVANWKQLLSAVETWNEENEKKVVLPNDLHRIRIRDFLVTNEDADSLVSTAVTLQESDDEANGVATSPTEIHISTLNLLRASKSGFPYPESIRPVYQFFKDRDVTFVPEMMRNGSRLFDMSALMGNMAGGGTPSGSVRSSVSAGTSSAGGATYIDPDEAPHTWRLPSSIIQMIMEFFNQTYFKLPKKAESSNVSETAKQKKDKAMQKSAIPVKKLLDATFETDFETIKCNLLANYYAYNSLPIEDITITFQEIVNLLDELYIEIGVDKVISNETIEAMQNPFEVEQYADFLAAHLLDRDENPPPIFEL